ncbi:MAG: N-acetylglucosamine-6-phosphate deacetylase [Chthoniobacterales bacterium]
MSDLFVSNAQVVTPDQVIEGSILCQDGRIVDFGPHVKKPADGNISVFDAGGRQVLPGYIDIHSHGANGVDTNEADPKKNAADDVIAQIAQKKLAEGVTTWLPTTVTLSGERLKEIAQGVQKYRDSPTAARVPGLHVEGPFLNKNFIGAQDPEYAIDPDFDLVKQLHALCPVRLLSLAIELPGALDVIKNCRSLDIVSSCAHSAATYAEFKKARQAGLGHLTHFCNQMTPLHHREIGLVGAGLLDPNVKTELICDGLHVQEDMLKLIFTHISPDRILLITDSMSASWLGDGSYLLGELQVEVKNNAAHIAGTNTLAGTTLRFDHGVELAARVSGFAAPEISRIASTNQARSLGLTDRGEIKSGLLADLVVVEKDYRLHQTILGGKLV